jgi:hypothetical protein
LLKSTAKGEAQKADGLGCLTLSGVGHVRKAVLAVFVCKAPAVPIPEPAAGEGSVKRSGFAHD